MEVPVFISYSDMLLMWPYSMPQKGDVILLSYYGGKPKRVEVQYKEYNLGENNSLQSITIVCNNI